MAKITVYRYRIYDEFSKSYIVSKSSATRRAINAIEAEIIPDTAEEVDLEMINTDGIVVRRRAEPNPPVAPKPVPAPKAESKSEAKPDAKSEASPDAKATDSDPPERAEASKSTTKPL